MPRSRVGPTPPGRPARHRPAPPGRTPMPAPLPPRSPGRSPRSRSLLLRLLLPLALLLGLGGTSPALAAPEAADFKVLAFYSGTWDAAHIDFVHEANDWFPEAAAENGFAYTATNDWGRLADADALAAYDVVLFLDDAPHDAAQRAGFQRYMENGGGWLGFHVSAFTTDAGEWPWYYDQFLGSGNFRSNTWGPTSATLRVEDRAHPSTAGLPGTFTSSVSEWYSWSNDLPRQPGHPRPGLRGPRRSFPLGHGPRPVLVRGAITPIPVGRNSALPGCCTRTSAT
ncbi:LOW QUALITY PROTEIN: 40-residue YVTN beta-propeller repeat protein, partial [Streptomyces sp. SPB074]